MVDRERYRTLFVQEAREHLGALGSGLDSLRKGLDRETLDALFRAAHSFKGMAATLGYQAESDLAHAIEDHLYNARDTGLIPEDIRVLLLDAVDHLEAAVDQVEAGETPSDLSTVAKRLNQAADAKDAPEATQAPPGLRDLHDAAAAIPDARRRVVSLRLTDRCAAPRARLLVVQRTLGQVGTVVAASPDTERWSELTGGTEVVLLVDSDASKDALEERLRTVPDLASYRVELALPGPDPGEAEDVQKAEVARPPFASRSVRVDVQQVDRLLDQAAELRIAYSQLDRQLDDLFAGPRPYALTEALERLFREAKGVHDAALDMRTLPVRLITDRLPRLVRELSRRLDKEVDLVLEGTDAQADRSVLEALSDPLLHLVKNAIDHGLESPEVRTKTGKPATGTLQVTFQRATAGLHVEVSDDGRGIAREAAVQKAIERGLVAAEDAADLEDEEVFRLLVTPGFSTAEGITDISGRGVGLDAVKADLERVGGSMRITSESGRGTTIILELPPTLAIAEALEIAVDGEPYYIPVDSIVSTVPVGQDDRARGVVDFVDPHREPEPETDPAPADGEGPVPPPPEPVRVIELDRLLDLPERRYAYVEEDDVAKMERLKARLRESRTEKTRRRGRGPTSGALSRPTVPLGIIVERHGERACLLVHEVGLIQEIVVKSFHLAAARTRHVSGATIRGDGAVGLILDIPSILLAGTERPFAVRR